MKHIFNNEYMEKYIPKEYYCGHRGYITFFAEESDGINENLPLDSLSTFLEAGATGATTSSLGVDTLIKRLMKVVINNVTITPTIRPVTK